MSTVLSVLRAKFKYLTLAFVAVFLAVIVNGCGISITNEYVGTWMGIDQRAGTQSTVYQYEIDSKGGSDDEFTIKVTRFNYNIDMSQTNAVWKESSPHFFIGKLNDQGVLVSDIGNIVAEPENFRLKYGSIILVRKAKNTEVKLKYVVRKQVEQAYPGISVLD